MIPFITKIKDGNLKLVAICILLINFLLSKEIIEQKWGEGESLITFLNKKNISKDIYFNLSKTDQELCSEIKTGVLYQTAMTNNIIEDILIPISEEIQLHIYNTKEKYKLEIIPIVYEEYENILVIFIKNSPYEDIILKTKNYKLAHEFVRNFRKYFDSRRLQLNDKIIIKFKQKIRLGQYYGTPVIIAVTIQGKYKKKYIYQNPDDGRYYDGKGRSLVSVFFKIPLMYSRISDVFTHKRFHPILKRYKAHLGIDYAAPIGRKIRATAPGKIIYKGRKGGYGKTIIIQHKGGYKSLYAHQSRFSRYIKKNQYVKRGQLIGYVGSTGRSTGPHLHFGVYKNGRAINPAKIMRYSKKTLYGKTRKKFLKFAKKTKEELLKVSKRQKEIFKIKNFKKSYNINFGFDNMKNYLISIN
jgi:murein DD-endopeptidase MepM/ murein hydrolase activator NlpD